MKSAGWERNSPSPSWKARPSAQNRSFLRQLLWSENRRVEAGSAGSHLGTGPCGAGCQPVVNRLGGWQPPHAAETTGAQPASLPRKTSQERSLRSLYGLTVAAGPDIVIDYCNDHLCHVKTARQVLQVAVFRGQAGWHTVYSGGLRRNRKPAWVGKEGLMSLPHARRSPSLYRLVYYATAIGYYAKFSLTGGKFS